MTTDTLTCPYCNAVLGTPTGLTAGQRITCPRCGDVFSFRPLDSFTDATSCGTDLKSVLQDPRRPGENAITTDTTLVPADQVSLRPPRSNRLIAGVVLGVMFLMAGVGLAFMLMTQDVRRAYDTSRPPRRPGRQRGVPEPDNPLPVAVAPDKLAALGYVPSGVNFLAGIRIPELLASPLGSQVLRDPIKLGGSEYRLENLPAWVGLRLEDIDHLVFAAEVDDHTIPPFYLVVRTNHRCEGEALRQRLDGKSVPSLSKKKIFSFHPQHKGFELYLWSADEYTLVLALLPDQLESLPSKPVEDLRQLPAEVRSVLKTRREPSAPIWVAGHSRDWSEATAVKFLNRLKKEDLDRLSRLHTFGIWLALEKSLGVRGVFECEDAAAARGLETYFRSLRDGDPTFKTALDGPWLTLQFQTGPDLLARWLKR